MLWSIEPGPGEVFMQPATSSLPAAVVFLPSERTRSLRVAGVNVLTRQARAWLSLGVEDCYIYDDGHPVALPLGRGTAGLTLKSLKTPGELLVEHCLFISADACFPGKPTWPMDLLPPTPGHTLGTKSGSALWVARADLDKVLLNPRTGLAQPAPALTLTLLDLPLRPVLEQADREYCERSLTATLFKPTDGFISRRINRPISTAISTRLVEFELSPNLVTLATLLPALVMPFFLVRGTYPGFVLGAFLFNLHSILDGCDGELARLRFETSEFGRWLDTLSDMFVIVLFFAAFPIGLAKYLDQPLLVWGGAAIVAVILILVLTLILVGRFILGSGLFNAFETLIEKAHANHPHVLEFLARVKTLGKRDLYALAFLGFCAVGLPEAVFAFTAVALLFYLFFVFSTIAILFLRRV